jgi:hypothetical protein
MQRRTFVSALVAAGAPSLDWIIRRLEVWKQEPRARLDVRFDRKSSDDPEVYYLQFQLPVARGILPELSEGGMPFVPYKEQIPGTCRDYFAIDGWAHYSMPQGHWVWVTRDAPVLSLGAPQRLVATLRASGPDEPPVIDGFQ